MTSDDLYNMWSVASRAKSAIVQGRRLENLSWRLWYTSTIRAKIEMEEKNRIKSESYDNDNNDNDVFCDDQDELSTSSTGNSNNRGHSHRNSRRSVLPSDRPLFTSTCTSILAEIQDASFRLASSATAASFSGINHHHFTSISENNIVSPPVARTKSPANSHHSHSHYGHKKKKNVEKFLKKFKSNLEDITEQFDEKLGFTDEEEKEEEIIKHSDNTNITNNCNMSCSNTENSLTNSYSNLNSNFVTDEEGQDSSSFSTKMYTSSPEKSSSKASKIGLISKLLLKKTDESAVDSDSSFKAKPEPIFMNTPQFISGNNKLTGILTGKNHNDSIINNQLELMANNQYNRHVNSSENLVRFKSPVMSETSQNSSGEDSTRSFKNIISSPPPPPQHLPQSSNNTSPVKRIIDANALSTSLSATKFRLEDEFDSQIVIW